MERYFVWRCWSGPADHRVIVTGSSDGTARVWDPLHPNRELTHFALFGGRYSVVAVNQTMMALATSRGHLVFEL